MVKQRGAAVSLPCCQRRQAFCTSCAASMLTAIAAAAALCCQHAHSLRCVSVDGQLQSLCIVPKYNMLYSRYTNSRLHQLALLLL
jgi:hypothetical protein